MFWKCLDPKLIFMIVMENQKYSRNVTRIKMLYPNCINLKIWWGNNVLAFLFISLHTIQDTAEQEHIGLSDLCLKNLEEQQIAAIYLIFSINLFHLVTVEICSPLSTSRDFDILRCIKFCCTENKLNLLLKRWYLTKNNLNLRYFHPITWPQIT